MPKFIESLPILKMDAYKASHQKLYPNNLKYLYSVLTPRKNSYFPWYNKMVAFGYQRAIKIIHENFQKDFFDQNLEDVLYTYRTVVGSVLGDDSVNCDHIKDLHELGHLPIVIMSMPEGVLVPMGVPVLTIENTHPNFAWLPNALETFILSESYPASTAATTALVLKKILLDYYEETSDADKSAVDYGCHDFSARGHHGNEASKIAGLGHLTCFKGTDTFQAVMEASRYYGNGDFSDIGKSVTASEHSVMECFGTDQDKAFETLLQENPKGPLALVSDTYDYWDVVNRTLPKLKDLIMSRDGTLIVRPDSGDTKEILKGTLNSLWVTFGGEINSKGYKVLVSQIRVIIGEGISLHNFEDVLECIKSEGFSVENVTFGIGAYAYSVQNTRDTFGHAIKAQHGYFEEDGELKGKMLYKDPKTDPDSLKKSLKGAVSVHHIEEVTGLNTVTYTYKALDHLSPSEASSDLMNEMMCVYINGYTLIDDTLTQIREEINWLLENRVVLPILLDEQSWNKVNN